MQRSNSAGQDARRASTSNAQQAQENAAASNQPYLANVNDNPDVEGNNASTFTNYLVSSFPSFQAVRNTTVEPGAQAHLHFQHPQPQQPLAPAFPPLFVPVQIPIPSVPEPTAASSSSVYRRPHPPEFSNVPYENLPSRYRLPYIPDYDVLPANTPKPETYEELKELAISRLRAGVAARRLSHELEYRFPDMDRFPSTATLSSWYRNSQPKQ